jgi:hypothetical protein
VKALRVVSTAVAVGVVSAVVAASAAVAQSGQVVVMSGLDNPRGLTFGPPGNGQDEDDDDDAQALYVAEAGRGGTSPCVELRGKVCAGDTGAVSRLWRGQQERVVEGLPSYAPFAMGASAGAIGPQDVAFDDGRGYVAIGLAGPPELRATLGEHFGWIASFNGHGTVTWTVESNPNGLLEGEGGDVVADAGSNTLLDVRDDGTISTLAVFPSRAQGRSTDAVPTSVAEGPDDAYYVGELTGAPFAPGEARIWRVVPGHDPEVLCMGFSFVIDLDFDHAGNLYVLEHASGPAGPFAGTPGRLLRVGSDCATTEVATNLPAPTSVAIGPDGDAYVSINGTSAGTGAVVRIDLPGVEDEHDDD